MILCKTERIIQIAALLEITEQEATDLYHSINPTIEMQKDLLKQQAEQQRREVEQRKATGL